MDAAARVAICMGCTGSGEGEGGCGEGSGEGGEEGGGGGGGGEGGGGEGGSGGGGGEGGGGKGGGGAGGCAWWTAARLLGVAQRWRRRSPWADEAPPTRMKVICTHGRVGIRGSCAARARGLRSRAERKKPGLRVCEGCVERHNPTS